MRGLLNDIIRMIVIVLLFTLLLWIASNLKALTVSRTEPRRDVTKVTEITVSPQGDKTKTVTTTEEYKNLEVDDND